MYDYVIFHKNCFDGYSAFIILMKTGLISDSAIIYPDMPSAKLVPSNIKDKNVIIIDVAYKKEIVKTIAEHAKHVTFIDHHISIYEDIKSLKADNIEIIYNQYKSGSSLTWSYFYKKKKPPVFISYIEDNDIGAWKLKNTLPFITGLEVDYPTDLSPKIIRKWFKLFKISEVNAVIEKGKIFSEYKNYLIDENSRRYSLESFPSQKIYDEYPDFFKAVGQYSVAVTNTTCPNGSQLAVKMLQNIKCDFVIMWSYNMSRKEYILMFRSRGVDVASIAKLFGGGGHIAAASCSFPKSKYSIDDLFGAESLPRR